jgi:RHS repeat-associated protein
VTEANVSAQLAAPQLDDTKYGYNAAQQMISATDTQGYGPTAPVEQQCFDYDALSRLTEAYTAAQPTTDGSCPNDPASAGASAVGGPQPYWTSWKFDQLGQRLSQDQHALTSSGTDTSTTYSYGQTGHAHALSGLSIAGPSGTRDLTGYVYDNDGNVKTYPSLGASGTQTLSWSPQGRLISDSTASGDTTTQVNDADGNQLITRDSATNTDTLYLPGEQLAYNTKTGVATGTRYYTFGTNVVAERIGGGNPQYVVSDLHSTGLLTVDSVTMAVTRRVVDPYGNPVAATSGGTWPDQRGFLGKPQDSATGLVDIGARQYDPATGRFLTPDAVFEDDSSQEMNGYTYSAGDPVDNSDPSGNRILCPPSITDCMPPAPPPPPPPPPCDSYCQMKKFLSDPPNKGNGTQMVWKTTKDPGHGIITVRFFIEDDYIDFIGEGDNRGFSSDPNASSRFTVAWDTDTGNLYFIAQASCLKGDCVHAHTIGGYNDLSPVTSTSDPKDGSKGVSTSYVASDAVWTGPQILGRISGNLYMRVLPNGKVGIQVTDATTYPSLESYQYLPGRQPKTLMQSTQAPQGPLGSIFGPIIGLSSTGDRWLSTLDGQPDGAVHPPRPYADSGKCHMVHGTCA